MNRVHMLDWNDMYMSDNEAYVSQETDTIFQQFPVGRVSCCLEDCVLATAMLSGVLVKNDI